MAMLQELELELVVVVAVTGEMKVPRSCVVQVSLQTLTRKTTLAAGHTPHTGTAHGHSLTDPPSLSQAR
ncbi:hypothetical protein E2C01_030525 [Portunus trituberculatus]|uniref:Uncharacterized protein n=1 Tax=Portunus trituberculatus TaxID=210409 RepID=A0A5B7ES94_PORTR|nr:hypothetical protein [Portunus trituberculatus]